MFKPQRTTPSLENYSPSLEEELVVQEIADNDAQITRGLDDASRSIAHSESISNVVSVLEELDTITPENAVLVGSVLDSVTAGTAVTSDEILPATAMEGVDFRDKINAGIQRLKDIIRNILRKAREFLVSLAARFMHLITMAFDNAKKRKKHIDALKIRVDKIRGKAPKEKKLRISVALDNLATNNVVPKSAGTLLASLDSYNKLIGTFDNKRQMTIGAAAIALTNTLQKVSLDNAPDMLDEAMGAFYSIRDVLVPWQSRKVLKTDSDFTVTASPTLIGNTRIYVTSPDLNGVSKSSSTEEKIRLMDRLRRMQVRMGDMNEYSNTTVILKPVDFETPTGDELIKVLDEVEKTVDYIIDYTSNSTYTVVKKAVDDMLAASKNLDAYVGKFNVEKDGPMAKERIPMLACIANLQNTMSDLLTQPNSSITSNSLKVSQSVCALVTRCLGQYE